MTRPVLRDVRPARRARRIRRRAFTLIELLVVVAIIATLLSMLLPALGESAEIARRAACGSNLKQSAVASLGYAASHKRMLPGAGQGRGGNDPNYMNVGTMRSVFEGYLDGYTRDDSHPVLYCPSADESMTREALWGETHPAWGGWTEYRWGYQYWAWWNDPATYMGWWKPDLAPAQRMTEPGYTPLFSDWVRGSFGAQWMVIAHGPRGGLPRRYTNSYEPGKDGPVPESAYYRPEGMNQAALDTSVKWASYSPIDGGEFDYAIQTSPASVWSFIWARP